MKIQMTIGKKFALMAGILLALITLQGGLSLSLIHNLSMSIDQVVTDPLPGVYNISQVKIGLQTMRGNAWKHLANTDAAQKAKAERENVEVISSIQKNLAEYEKTITSA